MILQDKFNNIAKPSTLHKNYSSFIKPYLFGLSLITLSFQTQAIPNIESIKTDTLQFSTSKPQIGQNLKSHNDTSNISTQENTPMKKSVQHQNISIELAQELIRIALQQGDYQQCNISVAVVDWSGDLVSFARQNSASKVTIDVAKGKARTAALIQDSTQVFERFIDSGKASMLSIQSLMPLQGGLPLYDNGQFIGAIGVSGCQGGHLDEQIALHVIQQFNLNK